MLHFLSRFSLATRIYTGFLFLGIYVVFICFASVFAVGYVHKEYKKANNIIENTRQLSVLENALFSLNRALYFFALKGTEDEKNAVEEAFVLFEEKSKEVEGSLEAQDVREKYQEIINSFLEKYRSDMTKMFSLHDKSAEAAEKVNVLAEKASNQLNALIEETTLPSASFALNGLREQLDVVLQSIDAVSSENTESQKQLNSDFAALKKAQNAAKQAEMINTKQLKALFLTFNGLEEETNRKLKIDQTLREKMKDVSSVGDENSKSLKELLSVMAQSCDQLLAQAEAGKISLQKIFVFAAALGGVLAVVFSFVSLFGIRYPLTRLIANAQEMARGEQSVLIHFTERDDEVGALAKALAALLLRLKEVPVFSGEMFHNRQNATYGSSMAYIPVNMETEAQENNKEQSVQEDGFAYFGQGVGVDTESQLCQMLFLVQHIGKSAAGMTENIKEHFSICRNHLQTLRELVQTVKDDADTADNKMAESKINDLLSEVNELNVSLSTCFSSTDETKNLLMGQENALNMLAAQLEQMHLFLPKLTEWGRVAGELIGMIYSLTAETKILALNASLEAAKAGEKAKSFASVSLDMRHKTHTTAEIARQLETHLMTIRNDVVHFAEAMNSVDTQIDDLQQNMHSVLPIQADQLSLVQISFDKIEEIKKTITFCAENNEEISSKLKQLSEKTTQISDLNPLLERQMEETEEQLDVFTQSLPVYEDDKDGGAA